MSSQAKFSDFQGNVTKWFNESAVSLTVPYLDTTPFSLTVRQDVVNAVVASLLPPDELVVLVDYVVSLGTRGRGPLRYTMRISRIKRAQGLP